MDYFCVGSFGKPKKINIVELGRSDGSLSKILLKILKNSNLITQKKYLFEISNHLKDLQKNKITNKKSKMDKRFQENKDGPVILR